MLESAATAVPVQPVVTPDPVYNCPQCSHYLQPGTLVCPDCQAIIYSGHLRAIAVQATAAEHEQHWAEAQTVWRQALEWLPPETKQAEAVNTKLAALDARLQAEQDNKAKWTKRLGPFAPVLFFLAKAKSFLFLLFKLKFLFSMVAFFGIYWLLFGWQFGLGFTLSIVVHEMGHYIAAKRKGLKVDLPVVFAGAGGVCAVVRPGYVARDALRDCAGRAAIRAGVCRGLRCDCGGDGEPAVLGSGACFGVAERAEPDSGSRT